MENYKEIPGFEDTYHVSDCGNVINIKRNKLLKPKIRNGYQVVVLSKNHEAFSYKVHQLVAMSFLNYQRGNRSIVVDHINNIRDDNRLINLQIISQRLNCSKDRKRSNDLPTGVRQDNKGYRVSAQINGRYVNLGRYDTVEEAANAYRNNFEQL